MPLYDYRCNKCEERFEARLSLKEKEVGVKPLCPKCTSKQVEQVFSAFGYVTKTSFGGSCDSG